LQRLFASSQCSCSAKVDDEPIRYLASQHAINSTDAAAAFLHSQRLCDNTFESDANRPKSASLVEIRFDGHYCCDVNSAGDVMAFSPIVTLYRHSVQQKWTFLLDLMWHCQQN